MLKVSFSLAAVLAVFGISQCFIPPAGKCRDDIVPLPIDFHMMVKQHRWRVNYVPDHPVFSQIDTEYRDVVLTGANAAQLIERIKLSNGVMSPYAFTYVYGRDGIVYETTRQGRQVFRMYMLDFYIDELAVLYYRCSDTGTLDDIDTRFILQPRVFNLSDAARQQLLAKDATYGFQGGIRELPNLLAW